MILNKKIEIICRNTGITKTYDIGITLAEIAEDQKIILKRPILGAKVNNKIKELNYNVFKPKVIEFFDILDIDGQRLYRRSLKFIFIKAVADILPQLNVNIEHSISKGIYCEFKTKEGEDYKPTLQQINDIKERMKIIVKNNLPFERREMLSSKVAEIYSKMGLNERVDIFKKRARLYSSMYFLENACDYFYGYLAPSTGSITTFDLIPYYDGLLLQHPTDYENMTIAPLEMQEKLFEVFRENKQWVKLLKINTIDSINKSVDSGDCGLIIKLGEALQEKKIAEIAETIKQKQNTKLVLIAGPSSSGKTTFSKRLCVQLGVCGLKPVQISLDNYFVNREDTPKDENGEYDFEALEALDYEQFGNDMLAMMEGKEVEMPTFNFQTGRREYKGDKLTACPETVFVVEGIHGLNPKLSEKIPAENKYKIYVSALTQVAIDSHNRIPTTDNRLLRRIIRDFRYRHYSAEETIKRWPSVRRGEDKNIFPFQEEADVMFNSALPYELGVIKRYATPVLRGVNETTPEYSEAQRLLKFLSYFREVPDDEIPPTSILREFLTGSSFHY
ncbi:MAG: nucleoside kinase [Bacteroidales bacterium]|nr:nucleoside kinase [Bacteroidales bacterium]